MKNNTPGKLSIIIRASGEATLDNLTKQLQKLKHPQDVLIVLDSAVSFEKKLKEGFEKALEINNPFTLFIDADILLRSNSLRKIKKICSKLGPNDFGFGLKLWDRFYDQPKFRGLHVYKTSLLLKAIEYIPLDGSQLRPESYVKQIMTNMGYFWRNDISSYIVGIHDFYQRPQDVYYKFLVRAKRSVDDLSVLRKRFEMNTSQRDFSFALKGMKDGLALTNIFNDKSLYPIPDWVKNSQFQIVLKPSSTIDLMVLRNCLKYYGLSVSFFKSF